MKHLILFLFVFVFIGCNRKCDKQNDIDTIFVSDQTSLVAHLDTIELLWRPTSEVRCSEFKSIRAKKCYALDLKKLNKKYIKKIRGIKIKNTYFRCVPFFNRDSVVKVTYTKEYNTHVNFKFLEEIKNEYKIMRIDCRNRKQYYDTMLCLESYYGQACLYSTSENGNPINRELANFVIWNLKDQTLILKDIPVETCIYPSSGKRQIQIILKRK